MIFVNIVLRTSIIFTHIPIILRVKHIVFNDNTYQTYSNMALV